MSDFYNENNQWVIKSANAKKVLIFGAKANAERIYKYWMRIPKIDGFIVSKREDNPYILADKRVCTFEDIPLKERSSYLLVISQIYDNIDKMKKLLDNAGFSNYIAIDQFIDFELYQNKSNLWCKGIKKLPENRTTEIDQEFIKKKLRIYAVTSHFNLHKTKVEIRKNFIEFIQAGAALTDIKMSDIRDDSGKNVSKENPQLCEMSAAYWIANNDTEHDYIGICHYSRGFNISNRQIMEVLDKDYDMIMPSPMVFYEQVIPNTDSHLYKAIERAFPEDILFTQKYLLDHVFFAGNLMIAKKEVYKEYIDWVFQVLNEIKKLFVEESQEMFPRYLAYTSEHLTNIFILKNHGRFKIGLVEGVSYI